MAHELSLRADGSAEMAFVGETPWHGLGTSVTKGASIGVWQKEAGMDWKAEEAAVLFRTIKNNAELKEAPSSKVIYRSDTGLALGVVGARYQIVQPREVLEFFRDLTESGGWHIHTAGVLREGRKLWAMASNDQVAPINPKAGSDKQRDRVCQNLLLATSLDGSMKTIAKPTAVRVVCANTLGLALMEGGEAVQISHRSIFDAQAVKRALGVARESFDVFIQQAREMAETPIALDEALEVLRKVFGAPAPAQVKAEKLNLSWLGNLADLNMEPEAEEPKESRVTSRVLELFAGDGMGADLKSSKGTRWGLFNAITQHVDHEMGRTPDTRLDSAWFGRGDSFKQTALAELVGEEA